MRCKIRIRMVMRCARITIHGRELDDKVTASVSGLWA